MGLQWVCEPTYTRGGLDFTEIGGAGQQIAYNVCVPGQNYEYTDTVSISIFYVLILVLYDIIILTSYDWYYS